MHCNINSIAYILLISYRISAASTHLFFSSSLEYDHFLFRSLLLNASWFLGSFSPLVLIFCQKRTYVLVVYNFHFFRKHEVDKSAVFIHFFHINAFESKVNSHTHDKRIESRVSDKHEKFVAKLLRYLPMLQYVYVWVTASK